MKRKLRLASRRAGGVPCPRHEVTLWVRTRYHDFARVRFTIDTGADWTAIPIIAWRATSGGGFPANGR
jgi:hypothetical protein